MLHYIMGLGQQRSRKLVQLICETSGRCWLVGIPTSVWITQHNCQPKRVEACSLCGGLFNNQNNTAGTESAGNRPHATTRPKRWRKRASWWLSVGHAVPYLLPMTAKFPSVTTQVFFQWILILNEGLIQYRALGFAEKCTRSMVSCLVNV